MTLVLTLRQRAAELLNTFLASAGSSLSQPDLVDRVVSQLMHEAGNEPERLRGLLKEALEALVGDVLRGRLRTGRSLDLTSTITLVQTPETVEGETTPTVTETLRRTPALPSGWFETVRDGLTINLLKMTRADLLLAIDARLHRVNGDWHRVNLLLRLGNTLERSSETVEQRFTERDIVRLSLELAYPPLASHLGEPYLRLKQTVGKDRGADGDVAAD